MARPPMVLLLPIFALQVGGRGGNKITQEVRDETLIPVFEAKHPSIKVTFAPSESNLYYTELPERLANGTACNLITTRPFDTSLELFNGGYLEDVTDMTVLDNFSDVAKTAWQTDDGYQRHLLFRWRRSLLALSTTRMHLMHLLSTFQRLKMSSTQLLIN